MTYCGRPSTACHACRQKRGKCDRRKPGCGQCARKRISCPGYRDPDTIVVRDQTVSTIRRFRAKRDRLTKELTPHESAILPPVHEHPTKPTKPTTTPPDSLSFGLAIAPAPEDAASAFFLFCYAPAGPMACLPILANVCSPADVLLMPALLAPALAILSFEFKQPSLMKLARKNYATALKEVNLALASPTHVANDSTLASVLLLALFEAVAFQRSDSLNSWTVHVNGAAELLKVRGPSQFESALGRALFLDVSNGIYASCAQRRIATPAAISELWVHWRKIAGDDGPEVGMGRVSDAMANLLARMTASGEESLGNEGVVREGLELDALLVHLLEQLEEISPYQTLPPVEVPTLAYNNVAHNYKSPQAARHWNVLRMMRMFVNKWVYRAASAMQDVSIGGVGSEEVILPERLLEMTARNSETMAFDVLSSVPFFQCLPSWRHSNQSMARWLIWPLSAVAVSMFVPVSAQMYARNSLQAIVKDSGLSQAAEALDMVDERRSLENWLHLCHLS
ncbi:hypothetical protein PV08_05101 [Exophiala spinifera]|uniref:Zn(2)-C6 fungal-type domain-containing protein n=1 Tax=Exophiala spinifera TaxID=91928 RepID=A0A0D1YRN6_9EURO|nr:uncharacterized protein PV08_05101 [Exophiala spinifera]KIW17906.1 hypothetical protein PV08_05101 [Exophiala spinifera]